MQADNYSIIDRLVHNLAMGQIEMQKLLSRLEDNSFDRLCSDITVTAPVFISSLPRSGTSLLLELVTGAPEFTTHTYRHMPFLLCPLTWHRISHPFWLKAKPRERAHGDGVLISYDSTEAFEEIIWHAFWPGHFEDTQIRPWLPDEKDEGGEFTVFLHQHIRKIIGLARNRGQEKPYRYVSKNNANIARLSWLARHFPDALFLIPYRDPLVHVASLLRAHRKFSGIHARDAFALRYMQTTGHLEFGKALKPIAFNNWLDGCKLDPMTPDFWAEYWIACFTAILETAGPQAVIFSYDYLCADPDTGLAVLEAAIGLKTGVLTSQIGRIRHNKTGESLPDVASERLQRMHELHIQLQVRTLF